MLDKAQDPLDLRAGLFANPYAEPDSSEGSAEDLASFGIQVNHSDRMTPLYRPATGG